MNVFGIIFFGSFVDTLRLPVGHRVFGNYIGNNMLNAQPDLLYHDDGFSHPLVLAKDGFYFFQFDPDTTDFGLVIDAAHIFVVPILPEPAQVSGAIQHLRL
jgi:hypothetical protein